MQHNYSIGPFTKCQFGLLMNWILKDFGNQNMKVNIEYLSNVITSVKKSLFISKGNLKKPYLIHENYTTQKLPSNDNSSLYFNKLFSMAVLLPECLKEIMILLDKTMTHEKANIVLSYQDDLSISDGNDPSLWKYILLLKRNRKFAS